MSRLNGIISEKEENRSERRLVYGTGCYVCIALAIAIKDDRC